MMGNVYSLNYLISKQVRMKEGKIVCGFKNNVDLVDKNDENNKRKKDKEKIDEKDRSTKRDDMQDENGRGNNDVTKSNAV